MRKLHGTLHRQGVGCALMVHPAKKVHQVMAIRRCSKALAVERGAACGTRFLMRSRQA